MNIYILEFKESGESCDVYLNNEFIFDSSLWFEGYQNRLRAENILNVFGVIENTHIDKTFYRSSKTLEEIKKQVHEIERTVG